jgi:chitinase
LFWRNDVPANKINLGLGFYGRSFTLDSPNCIDPGCPFTGPGVAGECTGQGGILSYAEIMAMQQSYNLVSVYDSVAAVKYIAWNQNQWVSYDDQETFQQKILYANSLGYVNLFYALTGLIWD